jgi:small subunit ribosomal protein S4
MGRYIGPQDKISRKYNEPMFGKGKFNDSKKKGLVSHGKNSFKRRISEYGKQLYDKNKLHYLYNIRERQLLNLFKKVAKKRGNIAVNLIRELEMRLDNVAYRLGVTPTRGGARQMVAHKHITVNGQIVNVASYTVKVGDVVGLSESAKKSSAILDWVVAKKEDLVWLNFDQDNFVGRILAKPEMAEVPEKINIGNVINYYSK